MADKRRKKQPAPLKYPKYSLKLADLLHFIYDDGFLQDCKELGLNEDDINAIEIAIMVGGKDSPVIEGTGGLRKMRFAPKRWNVGKSGAARVLFVFFEACWTVFMVAVYRKSAYDNISDAAKAIYRKLIAQAEALIEKRGRLG